jgi:transposase
VSQRPHRVRTWSPRGQTPVLQYNFNWDKLSAVAGITFYNFYFRLYKGSVKSAEVVDFLGALLRHIPGRLLIVWDRLSAHKSRFTQQFIAAQGDRLWMEYLPGYAPELNPVEYIWAYWKQHALPNVCPKDYWSLDAAARKTLKRMRRRPRLISAFWHQAELPF